MLIFCTESLNINHKSPKRSNNYNVMKYATTLQNVECQGHSLVCQNVDYME